MLMTEFTYALCVDCGDFTIGGRGHECKPPEPAPKRSEFELAYMRWLRGQLIKARCEK